MLHLFRTKTLMRSYLICGLLLLFINANAQNYRTDLNRTDQDAKPYYFGISLGVNLARFQTELHPRFLQYDSVYVAEPLNSGGIAVGFQATARLSNRFQVRFNPQLMFIERAIGYTLKYPDPIENTTQINKKV